MDRTRSAAVLATLGALAFVTLLAPPAGADDSETLEPFGRCDVYRPGTGAVVTGVDRCTTGMAPAGATVELPEPACPEAVPIPAGGGVEFFVGDCGPQHRHDAGAAANAEPAPTPAPTPPPPPPPPPPAPVAAPVRQAPATTSTVPSTTSTTFVAPPPPPAPAAAPSGGATTARAATAEVVTDPAASISLTRVGRPAEVEGDQSPLVMLFALALASLVLLGISRTRAERG